MNLPPNDQLLALLKLICYATVKARGEAWDGEKETEGVTKDRFTKIAKLMDAIHNIPLFLTKYELWDQHYFELCLESKETELGAWLHNVYSEALIEAQQNSDAS